MIRMLDVYDKAIEKVRELRGSALRKVWGSPENHVDVGGRLFGALPGSSGCVAQIRVGGMHSSLWPDLDAELRRDADIPPATLSGQLPDRFSERTMERFAYWQRRYNDRMLRDEATVASETTVKEMP